MAVRQRAIDRGAARGRRIVADLCTELEAGRVQLGLSYADLGRAATISGQQAARICRGQSKQVSVIRLAELLGAVGLDLSCRAYPGGPPVRDAAHLALLGRLRRQLAPALGWRVEVPVVRQPADLARSILDPRAWDAVIAGGTWAAAVEAETRLGDIQALERRLALKQRDGDMPTVVLLVNDTLHNRRMLRLASADLRESFPGSPRATLKQLRGGQFPTANTVVVL